MIDLIIDKLQDVRFLSTLLTAVAEPRRRGGGAAYVVSPTP